MSQKKMRVFESFGLIVLVFSLIGCSNNFDNDLGANSDANKQQGAIALSHGLSSGQSVHDCVAGDISSLKRCISLGRQIRQISLSRDISCAGDECCGSFPESARSYPYSKLPMLLIQNQEKLTIEGNGFSLRRYSGQRQCSAIAVIDSKDIQIKNLKLDEGAGGGCEINENCPEGIRIHQSARIKFERFELNHAKAYGVYVWNSHGFDFINSTIFNAGILGLYIGSGTAIHSSSNILIRNSSFIENSTNGVALDGVGGRNFLQGNKFLGNHHHGKWVCEKCSPVSVYPGGQLYVMGASNLVIEDNTILDGYCENCSHHDVIGIELGDPEREGTLDHLVIRNNVITNNSSFGILFDTYGSQFSSTLTSVQVLNNSLINNGAGIHGNNLDMSYPRLILENNKVSGSYRQISSVDFIFNLYTGFLNRQPDSSEMQSWRAQLDSQSKTCESVALSFAQSEEFLARKLTSGEWLSAIYLGLLGRPPDQKGYQDWLQVLHSGGSPFFVLMKFVESDEFKTRCP